MLRSAKPCIVAQFLAVLQEEEIFYFLSANHPAKCNSLSEALYSIPKNYPSSEEGFCLRNFLPCLIAQIRARCCEEANYSTTKSCRPAKRRFFFKLTIHQGSLAKKTQPAKLHRVMKPVRSQHRSEANKKALEIRFLGLFTWRKRSPPP